MSCVKTCKSKKSELVNCLVEGHVVTVLGHKESLEG